jgi:hypothetical protein
MFIAHSVFKTSKNQGTVMIATHEEKLCRRGAEDAEGKQRFSLRPLRLCGEKGFYF